jgi:DNA-binding winged helix-turn-helix (wHTH) protein
MQLPLVIPRRQHEPLGREGSPNIEPQASPAATDTIIEFGRFRVLLRQRRLLAEGVPVELGTRAFDLLMVLIQADGALVTKDELLGIVWPGIVVEQDNLKVHISALRKALGEDRDFIRTEFGRGYRFTAVVRSTAAAPECLSVTAATTSKATSPTDLSAIASQLVCLEAKLAEALNPLTTRRHAHRSRRRRCCVSSSGRRTPSRRPVEPTSTKPNCLEKRQAANSLAQLWH